MSLENHGGGVSSGALLQKCNVLNDATLNIASRHFQPAGAGATVAAGAATFGNLQITATNAGDVSGPIINSINAVGNSVKTLKLMARSLEGSRALVETVLTPVFPLGLSQLHSPAHKFRKVCNLPARQRTS
eukprot:g63028.t1